MLKIKPSVIIVTAAILSAGVLIFFTLQKNTEPYTPQVSLATSTPISEWETFENAEYGYSVLLPKIATINSIVVVPDIHKEPQLAFSAEGGNFSIVVGYLQEAKNQETFEKQKALISLDLKSYANAIRDLSKNSSNPEPGALEEVQFAGMKAYKFTLDRPYPWLYTDSNFYLKPPYWNVFITENLRGQKVVIAYPFNPASEKMVRTIRFIK